MGVSQVGASVVRDVKGGMFVMVVLKVLIMG